MAVVLFMCLMLAFLLLVSIFGWGIFIRTLFVKTYYAKDEQFDESSYYVDSKMTANNYETAYYRF